MPCHLRSGAARVQAEAASMRIDIEQEEDGRWIAEVRDLPGVLIYGQTRKAAISKVQALALGGGVKSSLFA